MGEPTPKARVDASPLVRRFAEERGIDLGSIVGTGPGGRIVMADVERTLGDRRDGPADGGIVATRGAPREPLDAAARQPVELVTLNRRRQAVARRTAHSKATVPHFYLTVRADVTGPLTARERIKASTPDGTAPSFNDLVVWAVARALRDHPDVNAGWSDGAIERYGRVNVGIAVDDPQGLVVATIFDADRATLAEIAHASRALVERVRRGEASAEELAGATFTVSNLGMLGVDSFAAIIDPPNAAILAVGRPVRTPAFDPDGRVVARDLISLTLSCDHRVLSGADAARFLAAVRGRLEGMVPEDGWT